MCGFIFSHTTKKNSKVADFQNFQHVVDKLSWRGPDNTKCQKNKDAFLGHCRLTILDKSDSANQPMEFENLSILFNGEIYNHLSLRKKYNLDCQTSSDTETILKGYIKFGYKFFNNLDGMFSIVIYDNLSNNWYAVRDSFGIKPLYIYNKNNEVVISSEASSIAKITGSEYDMDSIEEWKSLRRPIPGKSFFRDIQEVLPGQIISNSGLIDSLWDWVETTEEFNLEKLQDLLLVEVNKHELNDFTNVGLLSGGIDSSIIAAISSVNKFYSVGLSENNEFAEAKDTADKLGKKIKIVELDNNKLVENWRYLTQLKGEPLYLPNESLIFEVCKNMLPNEKVVLTGEGADEIFFGYDRIFRKFLDKNYNFEISGFLQQYSYSENLNSERFFDYIYDLKRNKKNIDFLEDFFLQFHLPGLLRRMDFASMAASKEARVPFVNKSLISLMYRKSPSLKINNTYSKIPLRNILKNLKLTSPLNRSKIGFSATINQNSQSRFNEYSFFQKTILESLNISEN